VASQAAKKMKVAGYSEGKKDSVSTIELSGNGSYTAKLEQVDYTGDWKAVGKTITLTPKTYMGMDQASFPATKKATGADVVSKIYAPYVLEISTDGSSMVHTDDLGVTTYKKS
jgi:hypothetical protein